MTIDVESMYTNIDHTKGLQAVLEVIGKYPVYFSKYFNTPEPPTKLN